MSLTRSIGDTQSPHFYAEMGELISSSGHQHFAANMLHLVDKWVPIHLVDLSEWTLDELRDSVREIKLLGSTGVKNDLSAPQTLHPIKDHPLLRQMLRMQDPLLIQMKAKANSAHPRGQLTPVQPGVAPGQSTLRDFVLSPANPARVFAGAVIVSQVPVGHPAAVDGTARADPAPGTAHRDRAGAQPAGAIAAAARVLQAFVR